MDIFYAVLGVMTFEIGALLAIHWFVGNVSDNLTVLVFNKNGSSLKMCSMVKFILGSRFEVSYITR